jgi:hypothetical protein
MPDADLAVPEDAFRRIMHEIDDPDSPVGINAQVAHVLIIHKLMQIEDRLDRLEARLDAPAD